MSTLHDSEITVLLEQVRQGNSNAREELAQAVQKHLRAIASRCVGGQDETHTLHPTALVNEAYVKLLNSNSIERCENRVHFFATAAAAMQHILVDHARKRNTQKRGAGFQRVALDQILACYELADIDVLALDSAIEQLWQVDSRKAKIVQLRFFAGLTIEETAQQLGISESTVQADWRAARAFLRSRLQ